MPLNQLRTVLTLGALRGASRYLAAVAPGKPLVSDANGWLTDAQFAQLQPGLAAGRMLVVTGGARPGLRGEAMKIKTVTRDEPDVTLLQLEDNFGTNHNIRAEHLRFPHAPLLAMLAYSAKRRFHSWVQRQATPSIKI